MSRLVALISVCLMSTVSQAVLSQIPVIRWNSQLVSPTAKTERPTAPSSYNLFYHEEGAVWAAHLHCFAYTSAETKACIVSCQTKMAVSFPHLFNRLFTCVYAADIGTLLRQKPKPKRVALQLLWLAGWGKVTLLCIKLGLLLLGLVRRIFHKRSNGLERVLFCPSRGMCLFHNLKCVFCAAAVRLRANTLWCCF